MTTIRSRPNLTEGQASAAFETRYGKRVEKIKQLDGERDQNFRVTTVNDERFVFKICNSDEPSELFVAQNDAMACVREKHSFVPTLMLDTDGATLPTLRIGDGTFLIRAVSWTSGIPLSEVVQPESRLLHDFGQKLAGIVAALQGFDHPALHRSFDWNIMDAAHVIGQNAAKIGKQPIRELVISRSQPLLARIEQARPSLRQSVIHNDANDHNVIVDRSNDGRHERVAGIIDFGDVSWSYTAAELAIAIAYVVCRRTDWLQAACELTQGFTSVFSLQEAEVDVLFDLVMLRLFVSISMNAAQQSLRPGDPYLSISQEPIQSVLPFLAGEDHRHIAKELRAACGY